MKPISMTSMRRKLEAEGLEVLNLHNIRVNGILHGCYGFAKGKLRFVYFTTEPPCMNFRFNNGQCMMYRIAESERDYRGKTNRWCSVDELPREISNLANGGIEY